MSKLHSLSVFFPAYNEAQNLSDLIQQAETFLPNYANDFEVIVVNDGSSDQTNAVISKLQHKYKWLKLISHDSNQGYGAALKTGIKNCTKDWIFFTDADLQFSLSEIKLLLPFAEEYQIIIGWRAQRADPAHRRFNARLFKMFIDLLFRLHVRDIDCAFKLMKRDLTQSVQLESSGAFTTSELLYKLKKQGIKFKEVPVSHFPRRHGNQTGANLKVVIKAGWEALSLYWAIKWGRLKHHQW